MTNSCGSVVSRAFYRTILGPSCCSKEPPLPGSSAKDVGLPCAPECGGELVCEGKLPSPMATWHEVMWFVASERARRKRIPNCLMPHGLEP